MADNNLPPSSTPPRPNAQNLPSRADGQQAQVLEVTGDLRAVSRPARLIGEVVQSNTDGRVRIKTEGGEIEINLRGRGEVPARGEKVEIDIAAGRPPRQAVVRELPQETESAPVRPDPRAQTTASSAPARGEIKIPLPQTPVPAQQQPAVQTPIRTPVQVSVPQPSAPLSTPPSPQTSVVTPQPLPPQILAPSMPLPEIVSGEAYMPLPASDPLPEAPPAVIGQIKNIGSWISSLLPQKSTPAQAISVPLQTPASKPDSVLPQPLQTGETIRLLSLPKGQESSLIVRPVAQSPMIFGIPDVGEADTVPPVTVRPGALSTTEAKAVPQTILPKTDVGLSLPSAGNILHSTKGMDLIPESLKPVTAEAAPPQALQASLSSTSLIPDGQATFPPAQTDHFDFRVLKIDTPVPDATGLKKIIATAQPQMPAGAIQAKVEGLTAQNFPVLSLMSPDGSASGFSILPLDLPDLAAGSVLTLMPQTQAHPVSAVLTPSLINPQTLIAPPVAADGPWPVLDDLAQIVRQSDPRAYQSLMQTIIPNAGNSARLPAAALLFISVVASGDIAAWMGEKTIDIIRRAGKGEALNRLSGEMGAIKKSSQEPVSSEWRGITLPMAWQDEIGRMMLYYRHDGGHDNDEEKKERTTRFVFDLNLTKMGPVQIDGFHKSERLDLIIRTKMVLSPDMQKTMRRAYASALENSRLFGEISFQNKAEQFIKIPAAAKDKFRTG